MAAQHIEASLGMASHLALEQGPMLASLVTMAIHEQTLALMKSYLPMQYIENEFLEAWLRLLDVPAGNQRVAAACRHDAARVWQALNSLIYHPTAEIEAPSLERFLKEFPTARSRWRAVVFRPVLKIDLAENLRIYREAGDRLTPGFDEMVPFEETGNFAGIPRYALVARSFSQPWLAEVMPDIIGEAVVLNIARTAIAAELFRRRHGSWPKEAHDLVPVFLDEP